MDTGRERSDEGKTTASQLLLFSIKHTVRGLARPQEPCVCVCVCVCVRICACARPQERGPRRAVKGAVNLEKGAVGRPVCKHARVRAFEFFFKVFEKRLGRQIAYRTHAEGKRDPRDGKICPVH